MSFNVNIKRQNKKVLILSASDGHNDNRVFKQAITLKDAGYDVQMISRATDNFPEKHTEGGITIHRIDIFDQLIANEKTRSLAFEVLGSNSHLVKDVLSKLTLYKEFDEYIRNLNSNIKIIKKIKPKTDRLVAKVEALQPLKKDLQTTYYKYNIKYIYWALRLKYKKIFLRKSQKNRDKNRPLLDQQKTIINDCIFFCRPFWAHQTLNEKFSLKFFKQFDIIHVHDIYPLVAGYKIAKETGAKLVYDAHEIEPERAPPLPKDKKKYIIALERSILPHTSKLIAVGKLCEKYYKDQYDLKSSGIIFNTPARSKELAPTDLREDLKFDSQKKILLYVGAVGSIGRGLDKVISALPEIDSNASLVVLGPRHKKNDAKLIEKAKEAGVEDRISLLPSMKHDKLVAYIKNADVGVCPIQGISLSYKYSMPNKLFEMAFAGLPICCSSLPEMKDFVESHGIGQTFDETKPESIAETINLVLKNSEKYKPNQQAIDSLMNEFSWEAQQKKLIAFYKEMEELPNQAYTAP